MEIFCVCSAVIVVEDCFSGFLSALLVSNLLKYLSRTFLISGYHGHTNQEPHKLLTCCNLLSLSYDGIRVE